MEELVQRVANAAGIQPEMAQSAIGMILNFLQKEAPAGPVGQVMQMLPGASEAAASASAAPAAGGGGLFGALGGMLGGSAGGVMGLAGQLSSAGLGMGQMQSVGKELFAAAQEHAGPEVIGQITQAVPGLSQFV